MKAKKTDIMSNIKRLLNKPFIPFAKATLIIGFFLFPFGLNAQIDCDESVVPPVVLDGVSVTSTWTGSVSTYPTPWTSCGFTTPASSIHLGAAGVFSYTFNFDVPVNDLVFIITASGTGVDEVFTVNIDGVGVPDVIDEGSCFTSIIGNTIYTGAGAGGDGGGGAFRINDPSGGYTSMTLSGPGGAAGSLIALCSNSVVAASEFETTNVICNGDCDGTATVIVGDNPPYTFLWDPGAGGGTEIIADELCAGDYTVEVTDADGVAEVLEITITEPDAIEGEIFSLTPVTCFGFTDGEVTIGSSGGTGDLTYDIGDGPVIPTVFTDLAAGSYTVIIEDEVGCILEVLVDILSPDLLEPVLVGTIDATCNGDADGELIVDGIGGVAPYEFAFDGGAFGPLGTFTGLTGGTYDIDIRDDNGCLTVTTFDIIDPPLVTLNLVGSTDATCFAYADGSIEIIGDGGTGILEYSIDGGAYDVAATFTDLGAGDYTISVQDENGCETSIIVPITEPTEMAATEVVTDAECAGDCAGTINLVATGGLAPYTFSIDACLTSDAIGSYTDLCAGDYDICIEDANGCQYTSVLNVNVGAGTVDASIVPFGPLCLNDAAISLNATDVGIFTGPGVIGGAFNPAVAGAGTHTITNTIAGFCGDVATFDVVVNPLPIVTFISTVNNGCAPVKVIFTNTGDAGSSCEWDLGDGSVSLSCGTVSHTYSNAGSYDVTLSITNANGCSNSATYYDYIDVYEVPIANFIFDPIIATTIDAKVDFTDYSTSAGGWIWDFDSFGSSTDQNPSFVFPDQAGAYEVTLIAVSDNNCRDTITKVLNIQQEQLIFVPNTITPDGDSFNEVFKPYFTGIDIYDYHLIIYNRWGEPVFESYNLSGGWNGTFGGEIVNSGVYVWHITTADIATDEKLEFFGHVTVLN